MARGTRRDVTVPAVEGEMGGREKSVTCPILKA